MKRRLLILLFCISSLVANADHITGGEMYYILTGNSGNSYTYFVTLKLFMRCNSGRQFPDPAIASVFSKTDNSRIQDITVNIAERTTIKMNDNADPCIADPPLVCYEVAFYRFSVTLQGSIDGYLIASEVNYRIRGISNLTNGNQVGATYTADIPGTFQVANGPNNNSAHFTGSDLVMVCANNYFEYSFAAGDNDGDQIRYSFCAAYNSTTAGANGVPAGNPPYSSLPYLIPFSQTSPLGIRVNIDPNTGLITGVAPASGIYVVTVCAEEIRNNKVIATQRKDLQINVAECSIAAARLEEDYMLCRSTRSLVVTDLAVSPLIVSYDWTVFAPNGTPVFTSTDEILNYTFPIPDGKYSVQLIVNKDQQCTDTAAAPVFVFPGMVTGFDEQGICITKPSTFTDRTTTPSGTVNSWLWDFGEPNVTIDFSADRNAVYTYPSLGPKTIRLTVTTTNGCRDTASRSIVVIDKPPITLAFRDTLICINDVLQLSAAGIGAFSWSPTQYMTNVTSATPLVSPPSSTLFYVELNSDGCTNRDSVQVNVVDHVTLRPMADTIICRNDTIRLHVESDGLRFLWSPAAQILDATVKNPIVITPINTSYTVAATIGGCSAKADIDVTSIPYPIANAGRDTTICYNAAVQLHASTDGTTWQWAPASFLDNSNSLNPTASPLDTLSYVFAAYNLASGCPKPGLDTVVVMVLPKIIPFAGRDTSVVIGQPLQLNGTGGVAYTWSPATALSAPDIPNPVGHYPEPSNGIRYKLLVFDEGGCVDSAFITVKVFATLPTIFVPTAFTPNNDGRNDILIPVAVGIQRIEYFNIYNRWGQLVFSTTINGKGWDGRIGGQSQATNTYVWMAKAVDYNGNAYFQKGMVTLIK